MLCLLPCVVVAVVFYDICPPYCPTGWAWVNYTANSTKLLKHLLREKDARLGLLVGDVSYANGVQVSTGRRAGSADKPGSRQVVSAMW